VNSLKFASTTTPPGSEICSKPPERMKTGDVSAAGSGSASESNIDSLGSLTVK
jgi:hypothetical protein